MRLPWQGQRIHNRGTHVPVGTRPAERTFIPAARPGDPPPEPVPPHLRRLRLRRRRPRMEATPHHVWMPVLLVVLGLLFLIVYRILHHRA